MLYTKNYKDTRCGWHCATVGRHAVFNWLFLNILSPHSNFEHLYQTETYFMTVSAKSYFGSLLVYVLEQNIKKKKKAFFDIN